MRQALRFLTMIMCGIALVAVSTPAFSLDPLTLFLLRVVRDKLISAGIEEAVERASAPTTPPVDVPPPALPTLPLGMDDAQLRRVIEEGFVHLTSEQRDEVYESARRILRDPRNAAAVPAIIADLAIKASGVRQALEALSNLSDARKHRIAAEAGEEYQRMPPETREEMASVLRARMVPMPVDLTDMILAEFDRVRAQTKSLQSSQQ